MSYNYKTQKASESDSYWPIFITISAHGVHLAIMDVMYKKPDEQELDLVSEDSDKEDVEDSGKEDEEDPDAECDEGFVLETNVTDAILPDMSESFSTMLQKVRDVVKFFRNGMVSEIFL
jgi:hypothetical protein